MKYRILNVVRTAVQHKDGKTCPIALNRQNWYTCIQCRENYDESLCEGRNQVTCVRETGFTNTYSVTAALGVNLVRIICPFWGITPLRRLWDLLVVRSQCIRYGGRLSPYIFLERKIWSVFWVLSFASRGMIPSTVSWDRTYSFHYALFIRNMLNGF